jgi:predicted CoA-binding protein
MNKSNKKTIVIGASPKPFRYSYTAVSELKNYGYPVVAIGLRKDKIGDTEIYTGFPAVEGAHTVSVYVGPKKQSSFYNYILDDLKPKRIIFNPGTENDEFEELARKNGIEVLEDCTLRMLSLGTF